MERIALAVEGCFGLIAVGHRLAAERPQRPKAGDRERRQALSRQKEPLRLADAGIAKVHFLRLQSGD